MNEVKRTERGWAGHFICADRCKFRRNTLLEYKDKALIVSTVGCLIINNEVEEVGYCRWYETMVFKVKENDPYKDADASKVIYPETDWGIWGNTWDDIVEKYPLPDNAANDMHERIVDEMTRKIKEIQDD